MISFSPVSSLNDPFQLSQCSPLVETWWTLGRELNSSQPTGFTTQYQLHHLVQHDLQSYLSYSLPHHTHSCLLTFAEDDFKVFHTSPSKFSSSSSNEPSLSTCPHYIVYLKKKISSVFSLNSLALVCVFNYNALL